MYPETYQLAQNVEGETTLLLFLNLPTIDLP